MSVYYYTNKIGKFCLQEKEGKITRLWLGDRLPETIEDEIEETPLLKEANKQLIAYFDKQLTEFSLPLSLKGTPFQVKIWELLQKIPYGKTITYGELAKQCGNANASRAVGMANGQNPIPVIIPCHRVIGSSGKLTGYTGGLNIKRILLDLENNSILNMLL